MKNFTYKNLVLTTVLSGALFGSLIYSGLLNKMFSSLKIKYLSTNDIFGNKDLAETQKPQPSIPTYQEAAKSINNTNEGNTSDKDEPNDYNIAAIAEPVSPISKDEQELTLSDLTDEFSISDVTDSEDINLSSIELADELKQNDLVKQLLIYAANQGNLASTLQLFNQVNPKTLEKFLAIMELNPPSQEALFNVLTNISNFDDISKSFDKFLKVLDSIQPKHFEKDIEELSSLNPKSLNILLEHLNSFGSYILKRKLTYENGLTQVISSIKANEEEGQIEGLDFQDERVELSQIYQEEASTTVDHSFSYDNPMHRLGTTATDLSGVIDDYTSELN